uniref:Lipocalin/cytosolic fatty-acid binding domain-containing protein n=1 Tax=Denticeps clupeoides TaxID=299321 RepID=A0AAY4ABD4_9TELE
MSLLTFFFFIVLFGKHSINHYELLVACVQFSGKWYRVGLAYDSPGFIPYRERFKISMGTVDPQPGGNVSMTMWSIGSSGCRSTVYFYEKTSLPGMFTYFSTRHNMVKDITVVDTNYTDYAIVFKYKKMDKEYSQVALYGRNQKLKPELLKKFKDFSLAHGFPRESILTPTKAVTLCVLTFEFYDPCIPLLPIWLEHCEKINRSGSYLCVCVCVCVCVLGGLV